MNSIYETLDFDQGNIPEARKLLQGFGMLPLLERVPALFDSLIPEAEAAAREAGRPLLARHDATGKVVESWDFVVRTLLAQSARAQFLYAAGHVLRGHSSELFGHVRTMVENAGVAHQLLLEPSLADAYVNEAPEYRRKTSRDKLFPHSDLLTFELNRDFEMASSMFHSNFRAVVDRAKTDFSLTKDGVAIEHRMNFHDLSAGEPAAYLRNVIWFLGVVGRVLTLFGRAFELNPASAWLVGVEEFARNVRAVHERHKPKQP